MLETELVKSADVRPTSLALTSLLGNELGTGFARDVVLTFGTKLLGISVGVVTLTLTTRLLGPEGRGQFAIVMTALALVLQFCNFGLNSSSVYYLSRKPGLRKQVSGLLFWFSLGGVGLVAILVYGLAARMPALLQSVPLSLLGVALVTTPAAMFLLLSSNALLGLGSTKWFNGLDLGTKLVGLIALALLFWWPLTTFFAAYAILHYCLAVAAYTQLVGLMRPGLPDLEMVKAILGYGFRAFLAMFFMFIVLRIDLFLVNSMLGTAEAGRYSVAVQVGEILSLTAGSIGAMLFPRLSAMEPRPRWAATWRVTCITAVLLGAGAIIVAVASRPIFLAWFGVGFLPATAALWWLLPGLWCLGVNTILYQHLAASGMPWFIVGATSFAAIMNILLNLRLIPAFGIAGAAGASSASYALLLGFTLWYLRKRWMHEQQA